MRVRHRGVEPLCQHLAIQQRAERASGGGEARRSCAPFEVHPNPGSQNLTPKASEEGRHSVCVYSIVGEYPRGVQGYLAHKMPPPPRTLE